MAFRPTSAAAFAHGAWNIYILQPAWLHERGVFTPDRPIKVETLTTGPGIRLTAGPKFPRWVATPFAVRAETDKMSNGQEAGDALARLVAALPDTPLQSVGFELVYQGRKPEDIQAVPTPRGEREPSMRYGSSMMMERDGVTCFLDLSSGGPEEPARLFALCDQPPKGDILRNFSRVDEVVREIAGRYWQVTFS